MIELVVPAAAVALVGLRSARERSFRARAVFVVGVAVVVAAAVARDARRQGVPTMPERWARAHAAGQDHEALYAALRWAETAPEGALAIAESMRSLGLAAECEDAAEQLARDERAPAPLRERARAQRARCGRSP